MTTQRNMKISRVWLTVPLAAWVLASCSDTDFDFEASQAEATAQAQLSLPPQALFNPADASQVPFPNNLLFAGSADGTLNVPIAETADQSLANPTVALNQLDGFSTVAPIVTPVSETLNPETLVLGDTVRVFEVTAVPAPAEARSAITGSIAEITDPRLLSVSEVNNQLVLIPIVPLKPLTSYMVVLTDGIQDMQGDPLQRSFIYGLLQGDDELGNQDLEDQLAEGSLDETEAMAAMETLATLAALEGLRGIVGSHSQVLNGQLGIDPANVVLTWVFTTQSTRDVLQAVKDISAPSALTLASASQSTADIGLAGNADIFIGALDLPYYQTALGEDGNPLPVLNGFWQNAAGNVPGASAADSGPDYTPVITTDVRVPVIMTVPNDSVPAGAQMPPDGWPVTIFQHGITGNRSQMLAIADAMASAGRAVIAIDMPLHGITDSDSPLSAGNNPFGPAERTFDLDVSGTDPDTGIPTTGPDGETDSSGTHFINLSNLANSRDNLRQAVADLFVLSASLSSAQVEGVTLDVNDLTFVGHSLGGIVGTTLLSYDNTFHTATLAMPGSGIAQLLANSESFGPVINLGLAINGVETGSAEFNQFLSVAQALVDSGDPVNHAQTLAASGSTRIHLIEVIGDQVIPNSVATAPLSGTEPLIRLLGLPGVSETVTDSNAAVRFTAGDHGSIISPLASPEATAEMQRQMAGYAATRGQTLTVTDASVLQVDTTEQ